MESEKLIKKDKKTSKAIDSEFFEIVIGYNLLFNELYAPSVIEYMKPSYLKNDGVKLIYNIVKHFYERRSTLPTITEIKLYLDNDTKKENFKNITTNFKTLDDEYNIDELLENTERFIKERAVYEAVLETVDEYSNNKIDSQRTLSLFESACNVSLIQDLGLDYFSNIDEHIQSLTKEDSYISSGYRWIDEVLGGGFLEHGRAMYLFLGETNVGKSILLGNLAANIAEQNKTVVVITLEMPEQVYARRCSSYLSKIPYGKLPERSQDLKAFVEKYKHTHPNSRIIIKEFPPSSLTVSQLNAYVKKLQNKGIKIDALVLDYIGLMAMPQGDNSNDKMKLVAQGLRAITYQGFPMITVHQANRAAYGGIPQLENTGDGISLPQTVDAQFSLYQEDGDAEIGVVKCEIQKSRFGQKHKKKQFQIDYNTLSYVELDDYFDESQKQKDITDSLKSLAQARTHNKNTTNNKLAIFE